MESFDEMNPSIPRIQVHKKGRVSKFMNKTGFVYLTNCSSTV